VRAFRCPHCGQLVFFENSACLNCGTELAFAWPAREIVRLDEQSRCANATLAECNWIAPAPGELCACCRLTRTRPRDEDTAGMEEFAKAEAAKRRLLFELGELKLPIGDELRFDMLSSRDEPVMTGHADGLITLDLAEADDAHRERTREEMGEPYRTVLGHLRHEVGHYYWMVLAPDDATQQRARALFGDERDDYQAALDRHYEHGAPPDWGERYVSAYATMHPMEDWAETFAHYLHIRDTLQTAQAFGLDAKHEDDMASMLEAWLPLTYALNQINRSMGRPDLYPFVLPPAVMDKLALVHELVTG
jgi:hypothetical protein